MRHPPKRARWPGTGRQTLRAVGVGLVVACGCGEKEEGNYFDPNAAQPVQPVAPAAAPAPAPQQMPAPPPTAPTPAPVPEPAPPPSPRGSLATGTRTAPRPAAAPAPPSSEDRLGEATALRAIGPNTSSADLIALLGQHENKYIRGTAAQWLAERQVPEALDALYAAMDDRERYVQRRAALAYARLMPCEISEALLARLNAERPETRFVAIGAANELLERCAGDQFPEIGSLHEILAALVVRDADPTVRGEAVVLLGRLRTPGREDERQAALLAALDDATAEVRQTAVRAFQGQTTEAAVDRLIALLDDDDQSVQKAAMITLAASGDLAGLEAVRARLTHENPGFRVRAAQALGQIADAAALADLRTALDDRSSDVRLAVVKALGKIDDPEIPALLQPRLKDSDRMVRMVTCRVLRERCPKDNPAVARALAVTAGDRDAQVAGQAVRALRCIRSTEVVPELVEALCKARSAEIRGQIAELLERTTHSRPAPTCTSWRGWFRSEGDSWRHAEE